MMDLTATRLLALSALLVACSASKPDGEPGFGDLVAGDYLPVAAPGGSAGEAPRLATNGSASNALPTDNPGAAVRARGCTKVDILFVVDNSLSMLEEQTALVRSFPGFMQVIEDTLGASDFHVMVVDTDAANAGDVVGSVLSPGDEACGPVLGAGRRRGRRGNDCGLSGERRYMDTAETELSTAFACVGEVGTFGDPNETAMAAVLAALGSDQNAPNGCNAGFLRDDAILVVTVITDEEDTSSSGDPRVWHDAIVKAKAGREDAIVFLGLFGGVANASGNTAEIACSVADAEPAPRLHTLVESFTLGSVGSICARDYAPFFARAVSVIDTACVDFEPVIR